MIQEAAGRNRAAEAMLAFVDPFGFSGVDMKQIASLLSYPRCELIFNFMVDSVVRFRNHSHPNIQQSFLDLFGGSEYLDAFAEGRVSDGLVDTFIQKVQELGQFEYLRKFEMLNQRGKNNFIIFATHNIRGLDAMKNAMWKVDPQLGKRFSDVEKNPLFASAADFRGLRASLLEQFAGKCVGISTIEEFVRVGDYRVEQLRKGALEPFERDGLIDVERPSKSGFPDGTRILFH